MVRRALTVLCVGFVCIFAASCGQTYKPQGVVINCPTCTVTVASGTLPPASFNLEGIGSQAQLTLTVQYSNSKTADVTDKAHWSLGPSANVPMLGAVGPFAPPDALQLNSSDGHLEAIVSPTQGLAACTWHATPTDSPTDSKFGYSTQPYPVIATYTEDGVTLTQVAYISVDAVGGCYDGQLYPAPTGFTGN